MYVYVLDSSRLGFSPPIYGSGEISSVHPRYYNVHYRLARHNVILSRGYRNTKTRKENKLVTIVTGIVIKLLHKDTKISRLRIHYISRIKWIVCVEKKGSLDVFVYV
jgi:hypothetical protein